MVKRWIKVVLRWCTRAKTGWRETQDRPAAAGCSWVGYRLLQRGRKEKRVVLRWPPVEENKSNAARYCTTKSFTTFRARLHLKRYEFHFDFEFDIYEEYTSENYRNIDVSLTLEDTISQSQSISQKETVAEPNQKQTSTQQSIVYKRELPTQTIKLIVQQLTCFSKEPDRRLPWGTIKTIALQHNTSRWTVARLWESAKTTMQNGIVVDVNSRKRGRVGRKPRVFDMTLLNVVPIEKRTTNRAMTSALGIGHSQVYRRMKSGNIRPHTNLIKPKLSHDHKIRRLNFILSQIIPPTVDSLPKFSLMYNVVHIDDKWFYMSRKTQRDLLCNEKVRKQTRKYTTVKVTRDVLRDKLINEVLPAIRLKWPANRVKDIWIQQDNAKPHILANDQAFNKEANKDGFNIRLVCQQASSLDMNILDLSLFSALQSIQFKSFPKDLNDLIKAVNDAYDTFEPKLLNYTWIQYQLCMIEVLKARGGNNYKNPHIGKQRLDRLGMLPRQLEIPQELIDAARQFLSHGIINLNDLPQDD
ncbi:uncharacterized protein LOC130826548 [Amaranthus tricolor]|uniref:uncharacterized protein LOC130826548 n=1 Tax=Amaranthus tricolor TaxID=29722 RepID=UPI002587AC05|nr:uncharacterized protein LOC130826548 [Amaranthus tricolor]